MTALVLSIRTLAGEPQSLGDVGTRAFFGALSGLIVPAVVAPAPSARGALLPGERFVSDLSATVFEGTPITSQMVAGLSSPAPRVHWCAVGVALPRGGRLERQPWLRFGDDPAGGGRALPLSTIAVARGAIEVRFGLAGAPLVPPPSRDQGGPVDRAWREAADLALSQLGLALRRLAEERLETELRIEGASDAAVARLERALRGTPNLVLEASQGRRATLSERPGRCLTCRHANQGTIDLEQEGLLACTLVGSKLGRLDAECDAKVEEGGETYYAFEPFDGANGTWATGRRLRFVRPKRG